jgi:hypothetical protein
MLPESFEITKLTPFAADLLMRVEAVVGWIVTGLK